MARTSERKTPATTSRTAAITASAARWMPAGRRVDRARAGVPGEAPGVTVRSAVGRTGGHRGLLLAQGTDGALEGLRELLRCDALPTVGHGPRLQEVTDER